MDADVEVLFEIDDAERGPHLMRYKTRGKVERYDWFDISREACEPFGFYFGDRVRVLRWSKEKGTNRVREAWVIGVLNGMRTVVAMLLRRDHRKLIFSCGW
jgi:hypothetical protein